METRTQNGNGSPGLLHATRDSGRQHVGDSDPREALSQQVQVLSLDQIRIIRSTNEYTEGPMVAPRVGSKQVSTLPASEHKTEPAEGLLIEPDQQMFVQNVHAHHQQHEHVRTSPAAFTRSESTASAGSRSGTRMSPSRSSLEHRLLGNSEPERIIRTQPKPMEVKAEKPKPCVEEEEEGSGQHMYLCEECGRCKCEECTCPRALPSCWLCGRRCVCSAQNVLDYGTCVCCVKCLFYHCSSDNEDNCVDEPCSCSQSHCCVRWSTISVLSVFLPCLLCYFPAKGCLPLIQCCYDHATRPGCRCKNTNVVHRKKAEKLT
ncbi:hypothetical protein GJAV_G00199960 [Gymnothorax javanicus]|nr:hypothetical protein GJAV_G00199960 [Gymnothorax javanicus]